MNALIPLGVFVAQSQTPEQVVETWVLPQAFPLGIDLEEYDPGVSVIASLIQPVKGLIFVAEGQADGRYACGPVGLVGRQLAQLLQNALRLRMIARQSIGTPGIPG